MRFGFGTLRKDDAAVQVLIVTVSCCVPGAALFEEKALQVARTAILETGIQARVKTVPATTAYFSPGPLRQTIAKLMADANQGQLKIPAVLLDGKPVFFGVPPLDEFKAALLQSANAKKNKEELIHG